MLIRADRARNFQREFKKPRQPVKAQQVQDPFRDPGDFPSGCTTFTLMQVAAFARASFTRDASARCP